MFTGLIEQQGTVIACTPHQDACRIMVSASYTALKTGESIAVNGVCLTMLAPQNDVLAFDVSPETLSRTNLGRLKPGYRVNLERALCVSDRLGGHYVSGHIDRTVLLTSIKPFGEYIEMTIGGFDDCDTMYFFSKGSITLDGVSLTINAVSREWFQVMLIPHTLAATTLGQCRVGHRFNAEFDYLARIVAHQLRCKEDYA